MHQSQSIALKINLFCLQLDTKTQVTLIRQISAPIIHLSRIWASWSCCSCPTETVEITWDNLNEWVETALTAFKIRRTTEFPYTWATAANITVASVGFFIPCDAIVCTCTCVYVCVCLFSRWAGPGSACGQRAGDEVASHGGRRAVSVSAGWRMQGLWGDTNQRITSS